VRHKQPLHFSTASHLRPKPSAAIVVPCVRLARRRALNLKLAAYRAHRCIEPTYWPAARTSEDEPGPCALLCNFGNKG
jgi:hypothetical protein